MPCWLRHRIKFMGIPLGSSGAHLRLPAQHILAQSRESAALPWEKTSLPWASLVSIFKDAGKEALGRPGEKGILSSGDGHLCELLKYCPSTADRTPVRALRRDQKAGLQALKEAGAFHTGLRCSSQAIFQACVIFFKVQQNKHLIRLFTDQQVLEDFTG